MKKRKNKCEDCFYFCQIDDNYGHCDHPNNEDKNGILDKYHSCNWFKEINNGISGNTNN